MVGPRAIERHALSKTCWIWSALILGTMTLVAVADSNVPSTPTPSPRTIVARCDQNYPPYEYVKNGIPTGYNVDIIHAIAREMNLNVRILPGPWSQVRQELEQGKCDVLLGMYQSKQRETRVDFAIYHSVVFHDVFLAQGIKLTHLSDLRTKRVGVQRGDIMHDFALREKISRRLILAQDTSELFAKLERGEIDAALTSKIQGLYLIRQMKLKKVRPAGLLLEPLRYGFAVRKGDRRLLEILNQGITLLKFNGQFDSINEKWFYPYQQKSLWDSSRPFIVALLVLIALLIAFFIWTISLREQVEARTHELRQIIDLVPHLILATDKHGRLLMANQAVARLFETRIQDLIGRHEQLFNPHVEAYAPLSHGDAEVLLTNKPKHVAEAPFLTPAGTKRFLQISKIPFKTAFPRKPAVLTVAVDITDLKEAEVALWESFRFSQEIISNAGEGILVYDRQLRHVVWNHFMEKITEIPALSALGKTLSDVFPPSIAAQLQPLLKQALEGETCISGDVRFMLSNSTRSAWFSGTYVPHRNTTGEIIGVIGVIHDLTERRNLEDQLQQAQKMEAIGHLAGGIAHDFNNLLTPILGYADFALLQMPPDSKFRAQVLAIQEAAERAAALTRQLLAFSLKQVLVLKHLNLNQEIEHFLPMLKSLMGETVVITTQLNPNLGLIRADASQLYQIMMNLSINARDAMPEGGTFTIATFTEPLSEEFLKHHPGIVGGIYTQLSISDTGVGMSEDVRARIFEPFFTTKKPGHGTGLGLSMVYGIIKQHGGWIQASSQAGVGTQFRLGFPIVDALPDTLPLAAPASIPTNAQTFVQGHETILLSEDEPSVRTLAAEILTAHGYRLFVASNGDEALRQVAAHPNETIDLLITDVIMPGINGKLLYERLLQTHPRLQVLYISGYAQNVLTHKGALEEGTQLLAKPFTVEALLQAVQDRLHP